MKKLLSASLLLLIAFTATAQKSEKEKAMALVVANSTALGLDDEALNNCIVGDTYFNSISQTTMVYLQQTYLGLPVRGQIQTLAFKNGIVVSAFGERIKGMPTRVSIGAIPAITPEHAVKLAMGSKQAEAPLELKGTAESNTKINFGKMGICQEDVTAELMWEPLKGSKDIALVWQVFYTANTSSDYLLISVDALTGKIQSETNLTLYCNFGHPHTNGIIEHDEAGNWFSDKEDSHRLPEQSLSPSLVSTAYYRVVPYPAESPRHPGGTPTLVTNPWTMAPGDATSLGWHNSGINDYTSSRGNNAWVQEDRDNNNNTNGLSAVSTTSPDPLTFDFSPDFSVDPTQTAPVPNQQFNMTNLFYWLNLTHDISYLYGFNEPAGNFQNNNQGRGGQGADYVMADAQDGGGTNNANFATPADGGRPRMQMYLWGSNIARDGGVDNGIVVHEYSHGISNRLTGGPSRADCLNNEEQMGEGWSDYIALMYTQDWANSNLNTGFSTPRGMSTYAAGQAITGVGIRSQRYCTNFAVNNKVYNSVISGSSHNRGELWCATLWDMTWNIINEVGAINPTIFDTSSLGGNAVALRLVLEGMKLQPCRPGFIDGRDAILQADQILYGGRFACAIKEAFRRRGMGANASQGSSDAVNDQTPDYSGGTSVILTQGGMTEVGAGQNIVYTNTVITTCDAINNYTLSDTLPPNVTWVSGGTYNSANRVVSWSVTQPSSSTQTFSFTVNVNAGSYYPTTILFDEAVPFSSMPATLSNSSTPTPTGDWRVSSLMSHSSPNSMYAPNLVAATDQRLQTVVPIAIPANTAPRLSFWHRFDTESGWDGGLIEISTNNGVAWQDFGDYLYENGYTGRLGNNPSNIISGRGAFSGSTGNNFIKTLGKLTAFAGQSVILRFRFGSDDNTIGTGSNPGWFIDDIQIINQPIVDMRSTLHNGNTRVSFSDTSTIIVEQIVCNDVSITQQPTSINACSGSTVTFSVAVNGTEPHYQWEVSTDNGATWTAIAGEVSAFYQITNVSTSANGNRYRVVITNDCPSNITSTSATLTVSAAAAINSAPADATVCQGGAATFSVTVAGSNNTYNWQVSTDGGATWNNINGATSTTLSITNVSPTENNNRYRLMVTSCAGETHSEAALLTVNENAAITAQPIDISACNGSNATFAVTASGTAVTYQWQISTDGGNTWNNISGATNATLTINNVSAGLHNNKYRVVVANMCTASITSNPATLSIATNASITTQPQSQTVCAGSAVSFNITGGGLESYQWQVSTNNGSTWSDINGATGATYTIPSVATDMNNNQYRVVVSGCNATGLSSTAAILTLHPETEITQQPTAQSGCIGTNVTFSINATGVNLNYQWQMSTNNGVTWTNIPGATATNLPVDITAQAQHNSIFRVVINGTCSNNLLSSEAALTIPADPTISGQPENQSVCEDGTASFTVGANNANSYQWEVSTDNGSTWAAIAGATSATLNVSNVTAALNNNMYHVILNGQCNSTTSNSATLNITTHPEIEINGPDDDVCTGSEITLSGLGANTYTWDNGITDGVPFIIYNTTTYTVTGTVGANCSGTASITVNVITGPTVTISATSTSLEPDETIVLTAQTNPTGISYQWYKNGIAIPGATASTLTVDEAGDYSVEVTGDNLCTSLSASISISAVQPNYAFITPNPSSGVFMVNYHNTPGVESPRAVIVYDAKGAKIFNKLYQKTEASIERMEVNLGKKATGVYMVVLMQKGKKLKSGKVYIH